MESSAAIGGDDWRRTSAIVNVLERALIEKTGREHGWENVLESGDDRVLLASARHRGRAVITEIGADQGWYIELPAGRLSRELGRTLPDLLVEDGRFRVADRDALAAVFRRAAELSQSLPDHAVQTFRAQTAKRLAAIADSGTEVERWVRQRVGQDVFRQALLDYWGGACAVTGLALPAVLRASHAKPWAECASDDERLDVFNGFLLIANLDALFDRGLITFGPDGALLVSTQLSREHRGQLHLDASMGLRWIAPEHEPYLAWHRDRLFERTMVRV